MVLRQESYIGRFILAFIISNLLFVTIFLVAYGVSYLNYQGIHNQNVLIEDSLREIAALANSSVCGDESLLIASDSLDRVGSKLALLESRFGKQDERVIEQKKKYSELEYEHLSLVKRVSSACNESFVTIIFFYSNIGELQEASENVGFILSSFKKENPEKIMVYSFDFTLDAEIIDKLKKQYKVEGLPYVLVNEKDVVRVHNIYDLMPYL